MDIFKSTTKKAVPEPLNTIIGEGSTLQGDLWVSGSIRIDGKFEGRLSATGHLTIGPNGSIVSKQTIHCQSAHISGMVKGDIVAPQRIHLSRTAKVKGIITTGILVIEEGTRFIGKSEMPDFEDQ